LILPPAPPAAKTLLPEAISASGYNTLLACPYQYHARYILRLAQLDDVQELIEKSDYGQHVHSVLQTFHAAHARVGEMPVDAAVAELERLSDQAFAADISRNYLARGWLLRWKGLIPDYLKWQRAREAEGWRWHAGEASRQITITTPQGRTLTLLGRIDRVDINAGAVAVLDYKTGSAKSLTDKLKSPGEDVQLPVYALLWGGPVAAALFLSIEREGVTAVPIAEDLAQLAEAARERLGDLYDAMSAGQPMPAQGAPKACEYCEMHGLCRREHW
jgi:ATP-dependent helicase/nuclease subunit B